MSDSRALDNLYGLWMRVKGPHNDMAKALGSCVKWPLFTITSTQFIQQHMGLGFVASM